MASTNGCYCHISMSSCLPKWSNSLRQCVVKISWKKKNPDNAFQFLDYVADVRIEPLKAWHDVTKFGIHYLMIFQFHFYLSLFHILHFMNILTYIFCILLDLGASGTKDLSHGFLANRWLVHNQFMSLGNPLEIVVHYLLIRGIVGLGYRDEFPMVSALVCMVTHWIGPTVSHDLRLSSSLNLTKLLHFVSSQPWENIELIQNLVVDFTYG